ncbi:hypothetical protein INT45_011333 [Circinella minor]|uniref:HECT-type E3 ubiquitin transferase n=1 Tax=Circinella minor TaxID=1195481 RepID=A0A8H7VK96_9FUNG|nr:hypothetical protein INT45_011333 [Circinella minor]
MEHPSKKIKRSNSITGRRSSSSLSNQQRYNNRSTLHSSTTDSSATPTSTGNSSTTGTQRYSLRNNKSTTKASSSTAIPSKTTKKRTRKSNLKNQSTLSSIASVQEPQQPTNNNSNSSSSSSSSKRLPQKRKQQTQTGSSSILSNKRLRRHNTVRKMDNNELTTSTVVDTTQKDNKASSSPPSTSSTTTTTKNQQSTVKNKESTSDDKSNKKGKAKALKSDSTATIDKSTRESATTKRGRRAKKQADPEGLESQETESDIENNNNNVTPVSYFEYFDDNDAQDNDHETEHVTFDDDPPEEIQHNDDWDHEEAHYEGEDDDEEEEIERDGDEMLEDMDEEDDDEEDDDEEEELDRVRRNLGLHMQSAFGGMMSDMSSRLRSILQSLKTDDPTMQLVALQELAEILSVSSEDNLAGYFASDSFVKELVRIMKSGDTLGGVDMDDDMMVALAMSEGLGGGNPELTLLACRCISNLLDALPTAVTSVVYHGAIGVLCQKLKSIEYIDLAEQALCALEKVASHLPRAVVHEGGLGAALMYFDFFSIHSQRTALRTAANCMRGVDNESFSQVMEIIPTLLNTVSYPDRTVVELSCLCWVRLTETYRGSSENLEKAVSVELLEKMMALIPVPGHTNVVRPSTFTDILRTFRMVAKGSPKLGLELLKLNVVDSLYQVLTGAPNKPEENISVLTHVSVDNKWRDSIYAILRIFVDVLPSLPRDDMFSSKRFRNNDPVSTRTRSAAAANNSDELPILKERTSKSTTTDPRVEFMEKDNPTLLKRIDTLLFPVLLEIYTSTVNLRIRQLVSHLFVKMTHFSNAETLQHVLRDIPLSSFLSGILAQQEHATLVIDALFEVELLLKKLPDVYRFLFEREGVQHEVETLANTSYSDESQTDDTKDKSSATRKTKKSSESTSVTGESSGEPSKDMSEAATPLEILRSMQEAIRKHANETNSGNDDEEEEQEDDQDEDSDKQQDEEKQKQQKTKASGPSDDDSSTAAQSKKDQQQDNGSGTTTSGERGDKERVSRRHILDRSEFHALLRSRFGSSQASSRYSSEAEKGIGRGSTRRYVIRLAQNLLREFQIQDLEDLQKPGRALEEIQKFAQELNGSTKDPCAEQALKRLVEYLQSSTMGVSSFELMSSGLLEALLAYLTKERKEDGYKFVGELKDRQKAFGDLLLQKADQEFTTDTGNSINPIRVLVMRLQEIVSRFEPFEVVTPLESSPLGDNFRNPTSMLAKQLRLRLTGRGQDIPAEYQHLMVSTHAVATFKVLEEYLLTRIAAATLSAKKKSSKRSVNKKSTTTAAASSSPSSTNTGESSSAAETSSVQTNDKEHPLSENMAGDQEDQDDTMAEQQVEEAEVENLMETDEAKESSSSTPETDGKWVIRFYLNDTVVTNDSTVYGAVHQHEVNDSSNNTNNTNTSGSWSSPSSPSVTSSAIRNIWIMSYPVTFERVWVPKEHKQQQESDNNSSNDKSIRQQLQNTERPSNLADDAVCTHALDLLQTIASLARTVIDESKVSAIPALDFVNRKLTAKMNRQLEEPLIVASSCLPTWTYWLMQKTPYLFPFETRYLFIQCTSFGYSRLIARWQSLQMRNNGQRDDPHNQQQQPVLGRMERQKVRIVRSQMLESAIKILDLFGSAQSVLEIEYTGEEGTGLGPTLEFYAATSHEFCKKSLNMWRDDDEKEGDYVVTKQGLFPKPLGKLSESSSTKVINLFKTLGQFIAKAMLDFRIIDFPFSEAFFKVALGKETPTKALIAEIDSVLGKSLENLEAFVERKRSIYADTSLSAEQKKEAVADIKVQDNQIDDLCLDFTLPGNPDIELKPDGAEIPVTIQNVEEFIELLEDMIAGSGVSNQFEAFRQGFNQLFAIDDLKVLTYEELVSLFGSSTEDWSYATLADAIKADHGFTMDSPSFKNLLSILSEMNDNERREFLQFTTGSPRLPIGGWKAMRPVFTVVCKTSESPLKPDDYLPSVMTCANYLKMPDYSSKDKMQVRLFTSMKEGKNSFLLS